MAIVTNIDADHMGTYGHDVARLKSAFIEFTHRLPFYGSAVVCQHDPHLRAFMPIGSPPITPPARHSDAVVPAENVRRHCGPIDFADEDAAVPTAAPGLWR